MRTRSLSLIALTALIALIGACTTTSGRPRSEVHYTTIPGTNDCVADPTTGAAGDWQECQPTCTGSAGCSPTCPDLDCTTGGGGTPDQGCATGYRVDDQGCPTCTCYDVCPDGTVPGPNGCNVCPDGSAPGTAGCPCGGTGGGSHACGDITDEARCVDSGCRWILLGVPCNSGEPCVSGVCQDPNTGDPVGCPDGSTDCNAAGGGSSG